MPFDRGHELLPKEIREKLPPLYANEELGLDALALVKFFTPTSNWTWYASEFDGEDIFFGLVSGFEVELGYFSLSELKSVKGPLGLPIERDLYYVAKTLKELMEEHQNLQGIHTQQCICCFKFLNFIMVLAPIFEQFHRLS